MSHFTTAHFLLNVHMGTINLSAKLGATTFSIMTLSTKGLFATISIKTLAIMTLSITTLSHAECHYGECRVLFIDMLNVVMLSVAAS